MLMTLYDDDFTYEHVFNLYYKGMTFCTLNDMLCEVGHCL